MIYLQVKYVGLWYPGLGVFTYVDYLFNNAESHNYISRYKLLDMLYILIQRI